MNKKLKFCLWIVGSIAVVICLYALDQTYYTSDKVVIAKYAKEAQSMTDKEIPLEYYAASIEKHLNKMGYKDVTVKVTGEDLPQIENNISIGAIPNPSPVDRLLGKTPHRIVISYTFINQKF